MPTEAEWEYACRAGTTTRWSFGDNWQDLPQHAWFVSNSVRRTHWAGELLANPYGLHDMHGNVWEWCWDWFAEYAAAEAGDPTGPAVGTERVLRGGAFVNSASVRSAYRYTHAPTIGRYSRGFRVARTCP